jgi:hypothetical protein
VAQEIATNALRPGLWAKAFEQAGGQTGPAQAIYIRLRVTRLKEEVEQLQKGAAQRVEQVKKEAEAETLRHKREQWSHESNKQRGIVLGIALIVIGAIFAWAVAVEPSSDPAVIEVIVAAGCIFSGLMVLLRGLR